MANQHPISLRKRVIDYVQSGNQITAAARIFRVGRKTIYRWLGLLKKNGDLQSKTPSVRKGYKIQKENVIKIFNNQPDATLKEVATSLSTHPSTIWYVCQKAKITRKKKYSTTKKKTSNEDKNL